MQSEQQVFDFEPIKGFPYLHWKGKQPYTSTQYFPAQCKERIGEEQNGWINHLYWGDNLQVMSHLMKEFRGKIDLIYIDPPFDSKADYKRKIEIRGKETESDFSTFEDKQYEDIWSNDEYLQFMYQRLILMRELLSGKGSIYVHCDWHKSHHLRSLMDEIFGGDNFVNEIVWQKIRVAKAQSKTFGNVHDVVLLYSKNSDFTFNDLYEEQTDDYITKFNKIDPVTGKQYQLVSMLQSGQGLARRFGDLELYPGVNKHWIWSQERIDEAMKTGEIEIVEGSLPRKRQYYDPEKGKKISDIWIDVFPVNSQALESEDYPTQKPEILLERITQASSNPGDLVFDCFMGSGTTQAVAMKLGRRFIGADINLGAIQTTMKRLSKIKKEIDTTLETDEQKYTSFKIFNVNNYDFFNNPVQAKELLIEALGIQKHGSSSCYDGTKEGRMVKIMPVNRIASKADISAFAANLPYSTFEERKDKNPHEPVERFTLVCMGHEPGLKAALEEQLINYKIDVEIRDILRDEAVLELKREAEADVQRNGNKLIIKKFYPMNLMQKLSLERTTVSDWKELVDSIMIDFNYDQVEMQPTIIDIPDKNGLVKGEYEIPKDAGRIKVKITDLISESFETELE